MTNELRIISREQYQQEIDNAWQNGLDGVSALNETPFNSLPLYAKDVAPTWHPTIPTEKIVKVAEAVIKAELFVCTCPVGIHQSDCPVTTATELIEWTKGGK